MAKIELHGDFLTFGDRTINLTDFVSMRPKSIVQVYSPYPGAPFKETGRDYPKIVVQLKSDVFEVAYGSEKERDDDLRELQEKIKIYSTDKYQRNTSGNLSINVAESSHINIVNQSSAVTISTKITESKELIQKIREAVKAIPEIEGDKVEEIAEILTDIEGKVERQEKVPRFTFKSLLDSAGNLAGVGQLVISLGQVLGMIP